MAMRVGYARVSKADGSQVLCEELGVTRVTLYRYVSPDGMLRDHGRRRLKV